jgi:hypothetical protein
MVPCFLAEMPDPVFPPAFVARVQGTGPRPRRKLCNLLCASAAPGRRRCPDRRSGGARARAPDRRIPTGMVARTMSQASLWSAVTIRRSRTEVRKPPMILIQSRKK